jgi:hypothetical protein
MFICRRQCEVLSHCVKPRLHHVGSDAASVLCATLSSPSHTMSNFSQAGSSTTHTMISSPQYLCSLHTNLSLHTVVPMRVKTHLHAAPASRHSHVTATSNLIHVTASSLPNQSNLQILPATLLSGYKSKHCPISSPLCKARTITSHK